MKCQAIVHLADGSPAPCPHDADHACVMTSWGDGGKRLYTCTEHRIPLEALHARYYVGAGSFAGKVVTIEAARMRRQRAKAQ